MPRKHIFSYNYGESMVNKYLLKLPESHIIVIIFYDNIMVKGFYS